MNSKNNNEHGDDKSKTCKSCHKSKSEHNGEKSLSNNSKDEAEFISNTKRVGKTLRNLAVVLNFRDGMREKHEPTYGESKKKKSKVCLQFVHFYSFIVFYKFRKEGN